MRLEQMKQLVASGKMGRRDFIQLSLAAGLTVSAANMLFTETVRATPKKGGHFAVGMGHGSTTDSLDPAVWQNMFATAMGLGMTGNTLLEIDSKNGVIPALALNAEPSDGAKKWAFNLRKGVEFHNGKSFTSADVIASYQHHRGEKSRSAVKSVLKDIVSIKADGKYRVIFELKSGNADFPYVTTDYHLVIFAANDDGSMAWEKAIGTGAYEITKYDPGVRVAGKRNANYWGETYFDTVEMLTMSDVVARTNALNSGDIHYMDRCDLKTIKFLKRNKKLDISQVTGFAHYTAPMNTTVAPFDNADVRNALKYSFDRKSILKKVLLGYGLEGNDNPITPSLKYAINPEPVHSYNPDKAKFHLKKAGLSSLKVDLSSSDAAFAGAVDAAVLMRAHAKAANIDINVIRESSDGYWDNVWMQKPWCTCYWGGRPTIDWMLSTAYLGGANWNDTFWKNARFDELVLSARSETNEKLRAEMYAEAQTILHDDGGAMVLMFNDYVSASSKKVAHGPLNSNYDLDGGYIFRRWWQA